LGRAEQGHLHGMGIGGDGVLVIEDRLTSAADLGLCRSNKILFSAPDH